MATTATSDGLVHHWRQGPADLVRLYAPITYWEKRWEWQFCYFLETPTAILGVSPEDLRAQIHYTLNMHGLSWSRSGVYFSEVQDIAKAQIVLRFTDAAPAQWPDLAGFSGLYYHDPAIGKNVAQVTNQRAVFDDGPLFAYILGMELAGHGCFRIWDMYTAEHSPYPEGAMGSHAAAIVNFGYPSLAEIAGTKLWLLGDDAVQVHDHPQFTVPFGVEHGN